MNRNLLLPKDCSHINLEYLPNRDNPQMIVCEDCGAIRKMVIYTIKDEKRVIDSGRDLHPKNNLDKAHDIQLPKDFDPKHDAMGGK